MKYIARTILALIAAAAVVAASLYQVDAKNPIWPMDGHDALILVIGACIGYLIVGLAILIGLLLLWSAADFK